MQSRTWGGLAVVGYHGEKLGSTGYRNENGSTGSYRNDLIASISLGI